MKLLVLKLYGVWLNAFIKIPFNLHMQEEESFCVQKSDLLLISRAWHSFYHLQRPNFIYTYIYIYIFFFKTCRETFLFFWALKLAGNVLPHEFFLLFFLSFPGLQSLRLWCRSLHIPIQFYSCCYTTRKKLSMEVTGPGSKISSTEQLLALILLSANLLIVKWIKAEISKKKD